LKKGEKKMDYEKYSLEEKDENNVEKIREETDVVVVLTTGKTDRGVRATLAFGWACTALALGKNVSLYLTMDGTVWAMKNAAKTVKVEGFEPLQAYIDQFIELGGKIFACAPCSEYYCSLPNADESDYQIISQAKLSGLSTIVSMVTSQTSVIAF
jgi:predicted peroxiredoxin